MRLYRRSLSAAALLGVFGAAMRRTAHAETAEAVAVEQAVEAMRKATIAVDTAVLGRLFSDGLSYGHSDGRVQSKAVVIDGLVTKKSAFPSITLTNQTVSIVGDDAIVRHHFDGDTLAGGKPGHVSLQVLQVWQKHGGAWTLIARQGFNI
jgi:ketosteroid isomerase-like protein